MSFLDKLANNKNEASLSHKMRSKRFMFFLSLIKDLPRPLSILDIGGTEEFWKAMRFHEEEIHITLLNLTEASISNPDMQSVAGDATNLHMFADQSFDLVFSNSVIEHLFTWENQQKMAAEVQRVSNRFFIQTPNYWFPVEPHWVFPLFQYLPFPLRVFLTQNFSLGHIQKSLSKREAIEQVREIRLLSLREMKQLFPDANIYAEKFLGFDKSFIAYKM